MKFYQIYAKVQYSDHNFSMFEPTLLSYKDAKKRIKKLQSEYPGSLTFILMRTAIERNK